MKLTLKFRWAIRMLPQPLPFETRGAFSNPVLQQWHEAEGWEHDDYVSAGGEWQDVETVIVGVEAPKQ